MYRSIDERLFIDEKWRNDISEDARMAFVLLLVHPSTTSLGAHVGDAQALDAWHPGRWGVERWQHALDELQRVGMLCVDARRRLLWLPRFLRYNSPPNPNVVRSWAAHIARLPRSPLVQRILHCAAVETAERGKPWHDAFVQTFGPQHDEPSQEGFDNPSDTLPDSVDNPSERVPEPYRKHEHRSQTQNTNTNTLPSVANTHTPPAREATNGRANTATNVDPKLGALPTRRRNPRMTWEALRPKLSVPDWLHEELLSSMGTQDEPALLAFYAETDKRYQGKDVGEDAPRFWRARFREWRGDSDKAQDDDAAQLARINAKLAARGAS